MINPKLNLLILFLGLLIPSCALAQYSETVSTDRPGQAIGPTAIGKRTIQLQTGLLLNPIQYAADYTSTTLLSSTVLRIGIWERFELNGLINWQQDKFKLDDEESSFRGISSTKLGGRFNITTNKGIVPAIGLQGSLLLKAQSSDYVRDKLGTELILTSTNAINSWFAVSTNLGVTWNGEGDGAKSLYVLNLGFALSDKIGAIAEVFGSFNTFEAHYDAGISYLVNPDFLLDLTAGWLGDRDVTNWFADVGLTYRLDWRK